MYIKQFDTVRAFAVFLVILSHWPIGLNSQFNLGSIGVTIFFVLSGFLIAIRYMDEKINFFKYLWTRFVRIYPIYFLVTLTTFIFKGLQDGFTNRLWYLLILNITFLRGFIENLKFSLVAQGWSLTVEVTFYIIAPIIFILLKTSVKKFFLI